MDGINVRKAQNCKTSRSPSGKGPVVQNPTGDLFKSLDVYGLPQPI